MIVLTTEIKRINYKSDFDFILRINAVGDDGDLTEVGVPDYDWEVVLSSGSNCRGMGARTFTASSKEGVMTNCFIDNGNIHIVCDNHGLASGKVHAEMYSYLPNNIYPDGKKRIVAPQPLGIELVVGAGEMPTALDIDVLAPYLLMGQNITVDTELSLESTNPVQNKVITLELTSAKEEVQALSLSVADHEERLAKVEQFIGGAEGEENLLEVVKANTTEISALKLETETLQQQIDTLNADFQTIGSVDQKIADAMAWEEASEII